MTSNTTWLIQLLVSHCSKDQKTLKKMNKVNGQDLDSRYSV
jgi:hypothetical protein